MQPPTQGKTSESGLRTPKTKLACINCRRGVQRNGGLYWTNRHPSRTF